MAKNEPNSKTADKRLVDAGPGFFPLKRKTSYSWLSQE